MPELNIFAQILVVGFPVVFALVWHEVSHGYAALRLGDATAARAGRLSLNPVTHVDAVGSILIPLTFFTVGKFFGAPTLFGWAKPVPIVAENLRKPRRDMALVALAGPAANLAMLIGWVVFLKLLLMLQLPWRGLVTTLRLMGELGVMFNAVIGLLNLLPILPLDGGRVLNSLLPPNIARRHAESERYGLFVAGGLLIAFATTGGLAVASRALMNGFEKFFNVNFLFF